MDQKYLERLHKTGIGEMRVIGRKVGVVRPTTLKRDDLAAKIIGIADGIQRPIPQTLSGKKPVEVELSDHAMELVDYVIRSSRAHTAYDVTSDRKSGVLCSNVDPFTEYATASQAMNAQKSVDGYIFVQSSGEVCLVNDEFSKQIILTDKMVKSCPYINSGMYVTLLKTEDNTYDVESIDGVPIFAYAPQLLWGELDKVQGAVALQVEDSIPIPYGAVLGVGTHDESDFVNFVMANGWFDAVRVLGWDGVDPSNRYPLADSATYYALNLARDEASVDFCLNRAMRQAEMGLRVLLVAVGVTQCTFDRFACRWSEMAGAKACSGSITVIFAGDFCATLPIWIESRGNGTIDLTKSFSKSAEREKNSAYLEMRAITSGLTADKAYSAWHCHLLEKYRG